LDGESISARIKRKIGRLIDSRSDQAQDLAGNRFPLGSSARFGWKSIPARIKRKIWLEIDFRSDNEQNRTKNRFPPR
jgi:hypothetical protein